MSKLSSTSSSSSVFFFLSAFFFCRLSYRLHEATWSLIFGTVSHLCSWWMWAASDASQRSPAPFPLPEPRRRRECRVGSGCCVFFFVVVLIIIIFFNWLASLARFCYRFARRRTAGETDARFSSVCSRPVCAPRCRSGVVELVQISDKTCFVVSFFFLFCFKTYGFHPLFFKQHKRHMRNTHSMLVLLNM